MAMRSPQADGMALLASANVASNTSAISIAAHMGQRARTALHGALKIVVFPAGASITNGNLETSHDLDLPERRAVEAHQEG